jgi:small GTP-binding protein
MRLNEEKDEEYEIEILSNDTEKYDKNYKIGLFGDNEVGKTNLLNRVIKNEFSENYEKTNNYVILNMYLKINNHCIKLQIWDISGDYKISDFHLLSNLQLVILCYSIENKASFQNIGNWLNVLKKDSQSSIKFFLVGNKCDLKNRVINKDEGEKFKQKNSLDFFDENSAKNGYNSSEIFIEAAKCIYKNSTIKNNIEINQNDEVSIERDDKSSCSCTII